MFGDFHHIAFVVLVTSDLWLHLSIKTALLDLGNKTTQLFGKKPTADPSTTLLLTFYTMSS